MTAYSKGKKMKIYISKKQFHDKFPFIKDTGHCKDQQPRVFWGEVRLMRLSTPK